MKSGKYKEYITLDELLAKDGYIIAEKKGKYAIHDKDRSKSRKTTRKNS